MQHVTILLVEDAPAERQLFREALSGRPCHMLEASTTSDALTMFRQNPAVNLIFLDQGVPPAGGIAFARELKASEDTRIVPIIMFSGSESPDLIEQAYNVGVSCFVLKPMGLDEYLEAVRSCFDFWCRVALLPRSDRL